MPNQLRLIARGIAAQCADAYSAGRYASWAGVAFALLSKGFTATQTEAIMRSKHMRWAADATPARWGRVPSIAIIQYIEGDKREFSPLELKQLIRETPQLQKGEA